MASPAIRTVEDLGDDQRYFRVITNGAERALDAIGTRRHDLDELGIIIMNQWILGKLGSIYSTKLSRQQTRKTQVSTGIKYNLYPRRNVTRRPNLQNSPVQVLPHDSIKGDPIRRSLHLRASPIRSSDRRSRASACSLYPTPPPSRVSVKVLSDHQRKTRRLGLMLPNASD